MKDQKRFKLLFQSDKMVHLDKVYQEFGFSSAEKIAEALSDWNLDKYFNITGTFVVRNENPTRWDSLRKNLKKAGKWTLTKCVPVAIGIATGGLGLGAVAAPAVSELVNKLRNRGLNVSEESQVELENVLLNKTDASIDTLMDKLRAANQGRGIAPDKLERMLRLSIKEDLHPFLAEIQAVLGTLQQEQEHLTTIFEDWTVEQRGKLEGLQEGMFEQFSLTSESLDNIENTLSPILEDLTEIKINVIENKSRLISMEETLDSMFREICGKSFDSLSSEEMFQTSRIQFQNVRLAGKFDKPYDEALFIDTPSLTETVSTFLMAKQETSPVFLLLASVGMGKTWNAVHLGVMARELKLAIPLFIPIHMGYSSIFREFFQIDRADLSALGRFVGEKCEQILSNTQKKVLLILDGLDEYPDPNREPFLNFLRHLLQGYKHAVRILLTDRTTDWCENKQLRGFYRDISHLIWSNTELKGVCNLYKIATPLSGFLDGFTDSQLNRAIIQYGLDREKFPSKLYDLCHKPYILRIAYEREQYFDPDNVKEFRSVFYNRLNPVNTILDRMGIANPRELLFPLFEAFGSASAVKTERDLKSSIEQNRTEWEVILRSGLLKIEQQGYQDVYKFDPVFHPVINDYLVQVGKLAETEVSTTIQEPVPEPTKMKTITPEVKEDTTQVSETRKKCDYFISLGKKYLDSKSYQDALANLQKARATCDEELFDPELLVEIDGLIRQVEAQMKKEAEEKAGIERENQLKSKYQELTNIAQQHFDQGQWDSAITGFKEVIGICQQLKFADGLNFAESMIAKAKERKILSFRGGQIPQFEADILQALETQLGKQFTLVNKVERGSQMGFSVGNNRVTGIGLYQCGVSTLPESIGNLSSLKELYLYGNQLSTLPESIGNLKTLEKLWLQDNKISTLPESIGNLKSLQYLYLDGNKLSTLPESIKLLEKRGVTIYK